jgi:hypothetical protein
LELSSILYLSIGEPVMKNLRYLETEIIGVLKALKNGCQLRDVWPGQGISEVTDAHRYGGFRH